MSVPAWLEMSRLMDATIDEVIEIGKRHDLDLKTRQRALRAVQRARSEISKSFDAPHSVAARTSARRRSR